MSTRAWSGRPCSTGCRSRAGRCWPSTSTGCRTCGSPAPADGGGSGVGPTAWRALFAAEPHVDLFLDTSAWGKGIAWVNGFCLGRYWRRGPQRTLFVPGPVLRPGRNELVVLELDVLADPTARFVAGPSLGPLED